MFPGNRWTLWVNTLPWTLKNLNLNEALIYEEILQSWNTKIQVRVGEAARGDNMWIALRNKVKGEKNKIITELQKKWKMVQDQIHIVKTPVQDTKNRNEENIYRR